jgi:hypothetical protein
MLSRCIAMLLLALLALMPAVGGAQAGGHCAPVSHEMATDHSASALENSCNHGESHSQTPCATAGLCAMAGCMAFGAVSGLQTGALASGVSFRHLRPLPVYGLAPAPLLEPPRA